MGKYLEVLKEENDKREFLALYESANDSQKMLIEKAVNNGWDSLTESEQQQLDEFLGKLAAGAMNMAGRAKDWLGGVKRKVGAVAGGIKDKVVNVGKGIASDYRGSRSASLADRANKAHQAHVANTELRNKLGGTFTPHPSDPGTSAGVASAKTKLNLAKKGQLPSSAPIATKAEPITSPIATELPVPVETTKVEPAPTLSKPAELVPEPVPTAPIAEPKSELVPKVVPPVNTDTSNRFSTSSDPTDLENLKGGVDNKKSGIPTKKSTKQLQNLAITSPINPDEGRSTRDEFEESLTESKKTMNQYVNDYNSKRFVAMVNG